MEIIKKPHHLECRRVSKFSTFPHSNPRKTKLFVFDKRKNSYLPSKISTEKMNVENNPLWKILEDNFTECESLFSKFLDNLINTNKIIAINNYDRKIVFTYIAMNVCRNPNKLKTILTRNGLDFQNAQHKSIGIDRLIPAISLLFFNLDVQFWCIPVSGGKLACPDSVIYEAHHFIDKNVKYIIMPLTHRYYLLGCYYDNGTKYGFDSRLPRVTTDIFTSSDINNFSFMSNCRFLCSDSELNFQINCNYVINDILK